MSRVSRAMRGALATGRVRRLDTAKALLERGWIEALPAMTGLEHYEETGEQWAPVELTPEGLAARARIKPLPSTPPEVAQAMARLRGTR